MCKKTNEGLIVVTSSTWSQDNNGACFINENLYNNNIFWCLLGESRSFAWIFSTGRRPLVPLLKLWPFFLTLSYHRAAKIKFGFAFFGTESPPFFLDKLSFSVVFDKSQTHVYWRFLAWFYCYYQTEQISTGSKDCEQPRFLSIVQSCFIQSSFKLTTAQETKLVVFVFRLTRFSTLRQHWTLKLAKSSQFIFPQSSWMSF